MDAVRQQWDACVKANVTPAVVAVFDGQLRVGLTLDECAVLGGWAGLRLAARAETVDELTSMLSRHWELGRAGVVISQPLLGDLAIPRAELAGDEATTARGPDRTPAELSRLQARLGDRVIRANVALLERNAALAALVALALNNRG